jgi:hypothetical protein
LCVVSNKNKCSVRTNQNKGQTKFSAGFINPNEPGLLTEQDTCDAPGFQPGLLTLMSRVNRVDFGQTTVNLGHHLENITDNP